MREPLTPADPWVTPNPISASPVAMRRITSVAVWTAVIAAHVAIVAVAMSLVMGHLPGKPILAPTPAPNGSEAAAPIDAEDEPRATPRGPWRGLGEDGNEAGDFEIPPPNPSPATPSAPSPEPPKIVEPPATTPIPPDDWLDEHSPFLPDDEWQMLPEPLPLPPFPGRPDDGNGRDLTPRASSAPSPQSLSRDGR